MKKYFLVMGLLLGILINGCASKEDTDTKSKKEIYYEEILALEDKMESLEYFKMTKTEDKQYAVCQGEAIKIKQSDPSPVNYSFHYEPNKEVRYIATKKVRDEIQTITQYYRNGKIYVSYSQMPYDLVVKEDSAKYAFFDIAIKGVDLKYYTITKAKKEDEIIYTITLKKAKQYNEKYPDDYDDKTCNIIGDYKAQRIILTVNKDGYLRKEEVDLTLDYGDQNENVLQAEASTRYEFYDYGVIDELDFRIVNAVYPEEE